MFVLPVKNTAEEEQALLEAWQKQARQLQIKQEAIGILARASVEAYVGFVDSLFAYYRNVRSSGEEVKDVD